MAFKIKKGFVIYKGKNLGELKKVYAIDGRPSGKDKVIKVFNDVEEAYKAFDSLVEGATSNYGILVRPKEKEAENKKNGVYEFVYLCDEKGFLIDSYFENVRFEHPKDEKQNAGIINYEIYADKNIHNCYELLSTEGEARAYAKWLSNNMKERLIEIYGTTNAFMHNWNGENWDEAFQYNALVAQYKNGKEIKK